MSQCLLRQPCEAGFKKMQKSFRILLAAVKSARQITTQLDLLGVYFLNSEAGFE